MTFQDFWDSLLHELGNERLIRNWTNDHGYLNRGDFKTVHKRGDYIYCILSDSHSIQKVSKGHFRFMYHNWEDYISGIIRRTQLRDKSRFTKYTISILHQYEDLM